MDREGGRGGREGGERDREGGRERGREGEGGKRREGRKGERHDKWYVNYIHVHVDLYRQKKQVDTCTEN